MGQDVSEFVMSYASIEQIKSALFKTSEAFLPEIEVAFDNTRGFFMPGGSRSILPKAHYNVPLELRRNGRTAFLGELKGVHIENGEKVSRLRAGNVMAIIADTRGALEEVGENPVTALYSAFQGAGFEAYLDKASFFAAAGPAKAAGAVATFAFPASDGQTLMEIASEVADACSLTIYTSGGLIRCQAFRPYQGSGSGLRDEITRANARGFGTLEYDDSAFANRVEVNYGASSTLVLDDPVSQARERTPFPRATGLDANTGDAVEFADRTSAAFFGGQLLLRSAYRRRKLSVTLGPEFDDIEIGHRHPVTLANLGLDEEPFEAVEVRKSLTTDDIGVVFVSLS